MKLKKASILIRLASLLLLSFSAVTQADAAVTETALEQEQATRTTAQASAQDVMEEIDLSNYFHGINGCAVLYRPDENEYSFYNESLCKQEISPYSTFKIISALSGLENGILQDETSTMNYNGAKYAVPEWNGNLTLQDAFQSSCIWYFRQVIDAVGADEMENQLKALDYGNCDISQWNGSGINPQEELNGFWLDSSLKISPLGQVKVLAELFEGKAAFRDENIEILKGIMLVAESDTYKIYGKTGSGSAGKAWFVGFKEKDERNEYFAVCLDDEENKDRISGNAAKEIALDIMN